MKILSVILDGEIKWSISCKDQIFVRLSNPKQWKLINPLIKLAPNFKRQLPPIKITSSACFLTEDILRFILPSNEKKLYDEEVGSRVINFLRHLRLKTKQPAIPTDLCAVNIEEIKKLPSLKYPIFKHNVRRVKLFTPIEILATLSKAKESSDQSLVKEVPIYADLLLDAINAKKDYKKAILYAAIAVETLANTKLHNAYLYLSKKPRESKHLRIINLQVTKDSDINKDPIFETLMELSQRKFRMLLHEIPLYLWNKSLMIDKKKTYDEVLKLHETRNEIAHIGEPASVHKTFPITNKGANAALSCAKEVFEWFGEEGFIIKK
ncbi:MAG: hypothetical protein KAI43_07350 [Candidatus Aureabacteria bacterium]|nr:hypothetical protein [Candidatus Auribacterota bacterium]